MLVSLGREPLGFFVDFGSSLTGFDSNFAICFSSCSSRAICSGVASSGSGIARDSTSSISPR